MKLNLRNKNFEYIKIQNTSLAGANFAQCNLSGSEFNNVNIVGVNLNGAILFNCKWINLTINKQNKLDGHTKSINSVCLSPDGNTLASGSRDGSIRLWDIKNKYCSDFFNIPLQYIQYYGLPRLKFFKGQESFLQTTLSFQENYLGKLQFLTITLDQFKNQPILALNLNLFQYSSVSNIC
ncbi:unnamed protein product [Paramecium pentaurelia]|uniref:Uncharacterized protein n=1 Tax=Paramecium pentaurelia TaxID=43138 RepID=A0A8S1XW19_9CILI|nr:unnamed protein product [Paramecium pentaurelia]